MKYLIYLTHALLLLASLWWREPALIAGTVLFIVPSLWIMSKSQSDARIEALTEQLKAVMKRIDETETVITSTKERVNKYISQRNPGVNP